MQSDSTTNDSWNFDNFLEWLYLNRVKVGIATGVVVLVAAGLAFSNWRKKQNEADANAALFALPAPVPANRAVAANAAAFQKIASDYPDTQAAERAELMAAGILFTDAKYPEAQRAFSKFLEKYETSLLRAQAALGVAASLEAQNKINEAVTKYQELIPKYSGENVIAPAKLTLARLLETQNKPEEALKLYQDLTRVNNPYDPWAAEANERREQLLQKFPALRPKPPITTSLAPSAASILSTTPPAILTNLLTNQPITPTNK